MTAIPVVAGGTLCAAHCVPCQLCCLHPHLTPTSSSHLAAHCTHVLTTHCASILAVNVDLHPVGIILKSNTLRGTRFEVSKEHWRGTAAYARLPDRVVGRFDSWSGRSKEDNKVHVDWESDGKNSDECFKTCS